MTYRRFLYCLLPIMLIWGCAEKSTVTQEEADMPAAETPAKETPTVQLPVVEKPEGYLAFRAEEEGFGLAYPKNWSMEEHFSQTRVLVKSPPEEEDEFQENVNVIVMPLAGTGVSKLEDFIGQTERDLATLITDFTLLESSRIQWAGRPAHEFIYTGTQEGISETLQWRQRIILNSENAFIFTYTGLKDSFNEMYQEEVDKILGSLVLKG